jgi:hypothetical protein
MVTNRSEKPTRSSGRAIKRGLGWLAILGVLLLALSGLSMWLILWQGAAQAVRTAHDTVVAIRPYARTGQIGAIGLMWWFWPSLIRRSKFPPAVESAWLAARHRLALWVLVVTTLSSVLWFPR